MKNYKITFSYKVIPMVALLGMLISFVYPEHNSGYNCMNCHFNNGPGDAVFDFSGTVYSSSQGGSPMSGVTVRIQDSTGHIFTENTHNPTGNFWMETDEDDRVTPVPPYTATVSKDGVTIPMVSAFSNGSCNSCHNSNMRIFFDENYNNDPPTVVIVSPANGDNFEISDIDVEILSENITDGDYFNAYIDGILVGTFSSTAFTLQDISDGEHNLEVAIVESNGQEYDNPEARATVFFTINSSSTLTVDYLTQIQPILNNNCVSCHSSSWAAGGASYEDYNSTINTGGVVPFDHSSSLMWQVVDNGSMPTSYNLSSSDIDLISQWIDEGALPEGSISSPPISGFTSDITNGNAPLSVSFTDISIVGDAPIISWDWEFGDGGTSVEQNPTYVYSNVGTFSVSLTVVDENGLSDSITEIDFITVTEEQVNPNYPNWSVNPPSFEFNMTLTSVIFFNGEESFDESDLLGAFVDGECRGLASPSFFPVTEHYTINLIIYSNLTTGEEITFRAYDYSEDIVFETVTETISFNVNDNQGNDISPIELHAISEQMDLITLIIPQETAFTGDDISLGIALDLPPDVFFNAIELNINGYFDGLDLVSITTENSLSSSWEVEYNEVDEELLVALYGSSSIESSGTLCYLDFVIEESADGFIPINISDAIIDETLYDINLVSGGVEVEGGVPPVADFSATPVTGFGELDVQFTNLSDLGNGDIISYQWDFGDGGTSNEEDPSHTYYEIGIYSVTLEVSTTFGYDEVTQTDLIILGIAGDVSLNGEVHAYDAALILQYLVDEQELSPLQLFNSDVSLNNVVTAYDASLIAKFVVELIDDLPYPEVLSADGVISMNDLEIYSQQDQISIPLYLTEGENILSFETEIEFDSELLNLENIIWPNQEDGFMIEINEDDGIIKIAGAGQTPYGNEEIFAELIFESESEFIGETVVNISSHRWNEEEIQEDITQSILTFVLDISSNEIPNDFQLSKIYPNPFNPTATIEYLLPIQTSIELVIFDLQGLQVQEIWNGKQVAGIHQVSIDGSEMTSGVYFVRMTTPYNSQIQKLDLMK